MVEGGGGIVIGYVCCKIRFASMQIKKDVDIVLTTWIVSQNSRHVIEN